MTDEERQRMIDFVLQQQAQNTVGIGRLQEGFVQLQAAQARTQQQLDQNVRQQVHVNNVVASIAEYQQQLAASQAEMRAAHAEQGERLDALINTVERLISERNSNNGHSNNEHSDNEDRK